MERNRYTSFKVYNQGVAKRNEIFNFVRQFIKIHEYAPTLKEISASVGVNFSTVRKHIRILVADGLLERTGCKGSPRNLRIPKEK